MTARRPCKPRALGVHCCSAWPQFYDCVVLYIAKTLLKLRIYDVTGCTTGCVIIIIDKTDAGLNGLCIRDITLIYDVINTYNNY